MDIAARPALERDRYQPAREYFEAMVAWLRGADAPMDHAELEKGLDKRGTELQRLTYQARLDDLSAAEKKAAEGATTTEGEVVRSRSRQLESSFGRLRFKRLGHKAAGKATRYPLDERLNLPSGLYTHPLQQSVAEEARAGAWERVVERVDRTTGGHVPKRQAEQIACEATTDFETFYAEQPANDALGPTALLVASSDSKGVRMLPKALREATRKAKEAEQASAMRGDPMARKKARSHDKRMAIVTAVWEQVPQLRTAGDIARELHRVPGTRSRVKSSQHRPQNKRVWASVEKSQATGISEMFDDLDRRDPERQRGAVVLVDGEENQLTVILGQGRSRGRELTIVLDLIHVIHYLWLAGFALCRHNARATEVWMATHLLMLLSVPTSDLIASIQGAFAARRLTASQRKPIERALKYFRRNASFMNYPAFLAQGLPIATGVIEGACRHLVQDRLGITGARWDLPGAEAILKLRALHTSGDWDDYWSFHQRREADRNYAAAA